MTIEYMHEQMKRLYLAAQTIKNIVGQTKVASLLNISPQTLNNWESRGMSKGGMITAQQKIGCSAVWLETGEGDMVVSEQPALEDWELLGDSAKALVKYLITQSLAGRLTTANILILQGRAEQMVEGTVPGEPQKHEWIHGGTFKLPPGARWKGGK